MENNTAIESVIDSVAPFIITLCWITKHLVKYLNDNIYRNKKKDTIDVDEVV